MLSASTQCLRRVEPLIVARCFSAHRSSKYTTQCTSPTLTRSNARPRARPFTRSLWRSTPERQCAVKRSILKLDDLPQGIIDVEPLSPQDDAEPEYPPLLQQVRNNMLKFKHCVLVTRVGGFYELYFEHADEFAPLLNLKKTKRKALKGSKRPAVSMSGFPAYQLDRYLKILVQDLNKHVAISDEFLNDSPTRAKGEPQFTRRVTRIVTPGTLIDEHFMNPWENNYLLSVHVDPKLLVEDRDISEGAEESLSSILNLPRTEVGLAWIDLSSGDFLTQSTDIASLPSAVARIKPREIVLDSIFRPENQEQSRIFSILQDDGHTVTFHEPSKETPMATDWAPMLEDEVEGFDMSHFTAGEIAAGGSLLHYVRYQLLGSRTQLQVPVRHQAEGHMSIDKNSLRALEIRSTIRDGIFEGSLLHSLKKTVTKSGSRLLTQRLCAPSMSLSTINSRLDLVEEMVQYPQLRQDILTLLEQTFDSLRLVTKFTYGRGDADDLMEISKTVTKTAEIQSILQEHGISRECTPALSDSPGTKSRQLCMAALARKFDLDLPMKLAKRINKSIDEDGLSEYHRIEDEEADEMASLAQDVLGREAGEEDLKAMPKRIQPKPHMIMGSFKSATDGRDDVYIMKHNASPALQRLHDSLNDMASAKLELQEKLRSRLKAESLTLKWTPNLAHIAHVKGKDTSRVAAQYPKSVSSSRTTRSFQIPEWTKLGAQMDETRYRIRGEEQRVLADLRAGVVKNLIKLRRNASILDELDVACSFALLAIQNNLIRPIVHADSAHNIIGGRHPVVEASLTSQGRKFEPNDCHLTAQEHIWLITGPNMAGKSTYLRQNALISILAQTGSFVPADYAEIGLVDKIFSRVGSADNLYQDQSTFMVEMLETAQILREATPRSFVIMDEVGRGTTPNDGVAVGYACLHHLYHVNQCRALFATHFHALADMTKPFEKLGHYCNDVLEEEDGTFSYVYRLRRGVNRKSHALKVARLAGLPDAAVEVAASVLEQLEAPSPAPK